jgi:hypothetical protein
MGGARCTQVRYKKRLQNLDGQPERKRAAGVLVKSRGRDLFKQLTSDFLLQN